MPLLLFATLICLRRYCVDVTRCADVDMPLLMLPCPLLRFRHYVAAPVADAATPKGYATRYCYVDAASASAIELR